MLSLESSTSQGSIALYQEGEFLFSQSFHQPRSRGEVLLQVLEQAVRNFGAVDRIVVGTGPGSYNGIRAAIAIAGGLKIAWKASVSGISSLLAVPSSFAQYAVVGDARGDAFFWGVVVDEHLKDLCLLPRKEFEQRLAAWRHPVYTATTLPEFPDLILQAPTAEKLAILAAKQPEETSLLAPIYLKPPHITQPTRHLRQR